MRRAVFCAVLLYCVLFWRINARALVFCDSMTDLASNSVKDYSGLAPAASSGIPDNVKRAPPAGSGLTLTSGQLTGWAQYRVQGADLVTVDIYTGWGTFVSMPPGEGVYALGMCQQNMGYLGQQQLAQAQLSRSDGGIFARVNGKLYKALDTGYLLTLRESSETPGELIDYGVNVYAAGEDGDFTRLSIASGSQVRVENMRLEWSRAFVFERLSYRVPAGATRVRIEINDHAYLDAQTSPGQTVRRPPATGMRTVLAQAAFSGENLSVGEPEPVVSHEDSRQSSQSAQSGSSRSSSSRRGSGSSAAGAAAPGVPPREPRHPRPRRDPNSRGRSPPPPPAAGLPPKSSRPPRRPAPGRALARHLWPKPPPRSLCRCSASSRTLGDRRGSCSILWWFSA